MATRKTSEYYLYRYFVVTGQLSYDLHTVDGQPIDPRDRIPRFLSRLEQTRKATQTIGDRKYLLYLFKRLGETVYICKLAREFTTPIHKPGEVDIERVREQDFPFVYVVIESGLQVLLIQKKTTVFSSLDQAKRIIGAFLAASSGLRESELRIDEITHEREFWRHVEEAEAVYWLNLRLKSPNLPDFHGEASRLLREIRQVTNQDELGVEFRNHDGQLRLPAVDWLQSFIRYITDGGGSWAMKILQSGRAVVVRSKDAVKRFALASNLEEEEELSILEALRDADAGRERSHDESR